MALLGVAENFVESGTEGLMSVWYVAEIAFDPLGLRRDIEGKSFGAAVGDL